MTIVAMNSSRFFGLACGRHAIEESVESKSKTASWLPRIDNGAIPGVSVGIVNKAVTYILKYA